MSLQLNVLIAYYICIPHACQIPIVIPSLNLPYHHNIPEMYILILYYFMQFSHNRFAPTETSPKSLDELSTDLKSLSSTLYEMSGNVYCSCIRVKLNKDRVFA